MKAREELIKEKVENLKSSKNLTEKDLQIDIMSSHEKIRRRGRHYFEYKIKNNIQVSLLDLHIIGKTD